MRSAFILVLPILMTACMDTKLIKTSNTLSEISRQCDALSDNELIARKKCLPLLSHKKLKMKVKRVSESFGHVIVIGEAGASQVIFCKLEKNDSEQIKQHPERIQVGQIYQVYGRFSNYTKKSDRLLYTHDGRLDTMNFTMRSFWLSNCKLSRVDSAKGN